MNDYPLDDRGPPSITIEPSADVLGLTVGTPTIALGGRASSRTDIDSVLVTGGAATGQADLVRVPAQPDWDSRDKYYRWTLKSLPLQPGFNFLIATAKNAVGKTATAGIVIVFGDMPLSDGGQYPELPCMCPVTVDPHDGGYQYQEPLTGGSGR